MGNMVNVSLLTDCWDTFKKNPEGLFRAIEAEGMHGDARYPYGRASMQGVTAHRYHHADEFALYSQYQNLSVHLSRWDDRTVELARTSAHMRSHLRGLIDMARFTLDSLEKLLEEIDDDGQGTTTGDARA